MLPPRPSTPEEPMPKVYYDPSFGKDSVVDVELRESGHLRDDVPIKVTLDAAADASAAEAVKKKMTRVRSQTLDYSPHDLQSARPLETFEFERNVVVKSDGELKNVTTESQRLANSPIPQNSSTTQKSDIPDAKALSKEVATLSTAAASTAHKSATSHTTDEPLSDAADLTTSSTTAGFVESKAAEPPNEVDEKSTIDSSGRKVIKPVSRRSAKTSIDPAHTAQGYFAPKKAPSSTHTTAASPSSTTSKAHSTSAFKPPVPEQQAASTPNPTTPTNPFYATNMTLPIAAGNIIAYFREASQWLTFWRDTLSTSELADLLRAKWDPKLKQITWHFACTVEFLEKGREGWKLTRLPEEFFNDALELVEGVGGLVGEMKERKRCQGVFEGVMGDVERVGRLLVGRREARWEEGRARWEAGLKAKGESG